MLGGNRGKILQQKSGREFWETAGNVGQHDHRGSDRELQEGECRKRYNFEKNSHNKGFIMTCIGRSSFPLLIKSDQSINPGLNLPPFD